MYDDSDVLFQLHFVGFPLLFCCDVLMIHRYPIGLGRNLSKFSKTDEDRCSVLAFLSRENKITTF